MMARVRGVIAARTFSTSRHSVLGSTSTMTGRALTFTDAVAGATHVIAGTMTSSPAPTSSDSSAITRLEVPFAVGTQYGTRLYAAYARANSCSRVIRPVHAPETD